MITSQNMIDDRTYHNYRTHTPPRLIEPKKKAFIIRRVNPVKNYLHVIVLLRAEDEDGNVIRIVERTKNNVISQDSAIRELTFDFVHELESEGYKCTIK